MNLIESFKSLFSPSAPDKLGAEDSAPIPIKEEAWGTSLLYSGDQFPQYNPDDLVGRKGLGIYRKMMIDEQCKSVVRFRRNATTGRKFKFIAPETDKLSGEEKQLRVDLFTDIVRQMPGVFKSKLDGIMSGMQNGFSLTEKVFHQIQFDNKTWYGISTLRTKPAESFEFYTDQYGNLIRLRQHTDGAEQDLEINDFIHFVQNPDVHEYYGQSELREAYRAYYSKDITARFHNMWIERMAGGFTWAAPVKGKVLNPKSEEYTTLKSALNSIRNNTSLILPSGIELNIEHPSDTQAFERAISMHDKAIAKSLLVPNLLGLSEQGSTGSFAQSRTQLEAFLWDLDSEARYLEETLNEQLFKHLGDINFGDKLYPKFVFNKLSFDQIKSIVEMWQGLVGANVVHNTLSDENYIRNLMELRELTEDEMEGIEVKKKEALNNARPNDNKNERSTPTGDKRPGTNGGVADGSGDKLEKEKKTSFAKHLKSSIRRIDFSSIDRSSEVIASNNTVSLTEAVTKTVDDLITEYVTPFNFADPNMKEVGKVKVNTTNKRTIKTTMNTVLKDGWKLGQLHADLEIKKGLGDKRHLLSKISFASIEDLAVKYFNTKSFTITGDITDKSVSIVRQEIMNGIQYTKTRDEVTQSIYDRFVKDGMIPPGEVPEQFINELLAGVSPAHRIETIVRTNSFEAINEGRIAYFEDPALDGFVEAYEYSAILDGRTTTICRSLGDPDAPQVHATNDPVWDEIKPPNHFNCRALLVAIIQGDEWTESSPPTVSPAEGFK